MVLKTELETSRLQVEKQLLNELRKSYPETKGMTYTGIVDWALRKLLTLKNQTEAS